MSTMSRSCISLLFLALAIACSSAELDATHGRSLKATPFRVVAFGDSTTEGWVPTQNKFIPYTITLQDMLQKYAPSKTIQVINKGLGASTVVPLPGRPVFIPYCKEQYNAALKQKIIYDWVVVWIGQNDLLLGNTADGMMKAMKPFFTYVLNSGSKVLFVAPVNYKEIKETDPKEAQRKRLFKLVTAYATAANKNLAKKKKKNYMKTLDLLANPATNPWKLSAKQYPTVFETWHLSQNGYKLLGAQIFKKITVRKY